MAIVAKSWKRENVEKSVVITASPAFSAKIPTSYHSLPLLYLGSWHGR